MNQITFTITDEQILKLAIKKAEKNGYEKYKKYYAKYIKDFPSLKEIGGVTHKQYLDVILKVTKPSEIIFSHDFAKAFWGEKLVDYVGRIIEQCVDKPEWRTEWHESFSYTYFGSKKPEHSNSFPYRWEYHLKQIVLEEDPIKYLEQFL